MGDIQQHTFSVEILTFSSGPDDEVLVRSVSEAFGIAWEDAVGIVERTPIRVKRGADGATTKKLVGQLMTLGADVRIRNEQTGDEKTYKASHAAGTSMPPAPLTSPIPLSSVLPRAMPAELRVPSDPGVDSGPPPISSLRRPGTPLAPAIKITTTPETAEPAAGAEGDPISEPAPAASDRPADRQPSFPGADRISDPTPISQDKQPDIAMCASCSRRTTKGSNCAFCGWSNADSKRYCRQCKKAITAASSWSPVQAGGLAALALAAAVAGFWFFGALGAAIGASVGAGAALALNGALTSYRCVPCKLDINEALTLRERELRALQSARRKYYVFGAFFVALAVGLVVPLTETTTMFIDSFGIAWQTTLPRTHTRVENKVIEVKTDLGPARLNARVSKNPRISIRSYMLGQLTFPFGSPKRLDEAALDKVMRQAVQAAVPGSKLAPSEAVRRLDVPGRESTFEATIDGQAMSGRVRAHQFNDEIVLVLVTATSADAAAGSSGTDYLDSLVVVTPAAQ